MNSNFQLIKIINIIFFIFYSFNITFAQNINKNQLFDSYDIKFYFIDIEANNVNTDIAGNTQILLQLKEADIDTIALEFTQYGVIDSILLNKTTAYYYRRDDTLFFALPEKNDSGDYITVKVYYNISGMDSKPGRGIANRSSSLGGRVTWTVTEPFFAKNWFPCKQFLTDKADSAYIFITIPDSLMAGSNGLLTKINQLPENKKRYEWKTNYPIAFYLISFSVANYMDYSFYASTSDGDSVLVQNYIYNDSAYFWENKGKIDSTKSLIASFSKRFGPYPFKNEKYGHCVAPQGGGMENQTMTTLNNFNFELVAHELAHQWFGDNVTCSDWQNIWINEGFASYGEIVAYEETGTKEDKKEWLAWAQTTAKTLTDGSVFVPENRKFDDKRIFDHALSYKKGALIIHMIRYIINNDELFYNILREFQSKYANSTASGEDFRNLIEEKTKINFERFFQQWFYGEGYPTLKISWEQLNDTVFIYVNQSVSAPDITPYFDLTLDFKLEYFGGDTLLRLPMNGPVQKLSIPFQPKVYNINADPDLWIFVFIDGVHRLLPQDRHAFYSIFPNPAKSEVFIENLDHGKPFFIKIYDLKGLLVLQTQGYDIFTRINIDKFEAGMYQIVIYKDDSKETYQLVKT